MSNICQLHILPMDTTVRKKELKIPDCFSVILTVCVVHFSVECFVNLSQRDAGLAKWLQLKNGADLSIYPTRCGLTQPQN